jgi:hypothetical protein
LLNKPEAFTLEHQMHNLIDFHKKKVGVWKLSVFRPERKNDSGEFIPP